MEIQFGTETEIGITREQPDKLDVVAESIALVRSATAPGVRHCWDYSLENPHRDMRGFTVGALRQDTDESDYFALDAQRTLSFNEIKSDLVLRNGARFYNDHAHPEYCTPECGTLLEILQQDFAGDTLLAACAATMNASTDNPVRLYKNNTDFLGHSYGCHENYLMPRRLPWDTLWQGMVGLFVTRQILCGSGKFGWEEEDRFLRPGFQISQRSDFFTEMQSVDTMQRRPLINTRDEPHANAEAYRRFHVIIGDANLSLFSHYLKIGTTALVLQAMLNGAPLDRFPRVEDPLRTLKTISRDPSWKWECLTATGQPTTGIEIQRQYLQIVREFCSGESADWKKVMTDWEETLNDLERDPRLTADRLDWAAKHRLIEQFREAEGLTPEDPWLQSLDLSYHLLDRDQGLFYGLLDQGSFRLPYAMDEICHGRLAPPMSTRAAIRGYCIERFGHAVELTQWDHLTLRAGDQRIELDLRNLFDAQQIRQGLKIIGAAQTVEDLRYLPFAKLV